MKILSLENFSLYRTPYSWKFSRDLYLKNFLVQTKFVKLEYFGSITQILSIGKIHP